MFIDDDNIFDDEFDSDDIDIRYIPSWGHDRYFIYYYEANEIMEQWRVFAKMKGVPDEKARLTSDEMDKIVTLFAIWKELFGYHSTFPLSWQDMDAMLHIHHFDLLMELYFNYKFRNIPFNPGFPD